MLQLDRIYLIHNENSLQHNIEDISILYENCHVYYYGAPTYFNIHTSAVF